METIGTVFGSPQYAFTYRGYVERVEKGLVEAANLLILLERGKCRNYPRAWQKSCFDILEGAPRR
jgi:hypothetical protein